MSEGYTYNWNLADRDNLPVYVPETVDDSCSENTANVDIYQLKKENSISTHVEIHKLKKKHKK